MTSSTPTRSKGRLPWVVTLFILAVILPPVVMILLGFLGPAPYLVDSAQMGRFADAALLFREAEVETKVFESQQAASSAARRYADGTAKRQSVQTMNERRFLREDNGHYELVSAIDGVLVRIEGRDREQVDRAFGDLPFIVENPKKNMIWVLMTKHLDVFFAGLGLYIVAILFASSRAMSWASEMGPATGQAPGSENDLRGRLLELEDLDLAFTVRESQRGHIVAQWRLADAKWTSVLEKGGLRHQFTLSVELDPSTSTARVIQTMQSISWSGGVTGALFRLHWNRSLADYRWESGAGYGLLHTDEGWRIAEAYRYRYSIDEIATPIAAAVLDAGWRFKPVYTFWRPLGG